MNQSLQAAESAALYLALEEELVLAWPGYNAWVESETGFCSGTRVRQLGEQLNRLGGFPAMQTAVSRIAQNDDLSQQLRSAFLAEVNYAWNGIGEWLA